jgi:stearoyl-CoA desaturase (delta-9 desaturase)
MTTATPSAASLRRDPLPLAERIVTLVIILLPLVGLIGAVVHAWGWGVGWPEIALLLGMYIATGLGITIGFHRLFTHKSFTTGPTITAILAVLGSMAFEGPLLRWVAFHRAHHQFSDGEHDPHSPHGHGEGVGAVLRGFFNAHLGWMLREAEPERGLESYLSDLRQSRLITRISETFVLWSVLSLVIPALIGGLIHMSWTGAMLGLVWGGLVRIFVVHHITWSVNSVCHLWGTRPFESKDESRNNPIVGVLAFGEGWHNNHHAFPTSARHGLRWWEFDLSYLVIRGLSLLGLARNIRVPSRDRIEAKRRDRSPEPQTDSQPPALPIAPLIASAPAVVSP